ncbi:MAG: GNAT family N-acetyltransferase [Pyrinomonadaceae bacterium]
MTEWLKIRLAEAGDAPSIVEFNQAMAHETEGKELAPEVLAAGVAALLGDARYGFYLIAEADAEVVGCLMITYEWSDWRDGLFWWIQSVYVRPEHRGRGVYRSLYADVKRRAAETGGVRGFRLYVEKQKHARTKDLSVF